MSSRHSFSAFGVATVLIALVLVAVSAAQTSSPAPEPSRSQISPDLLQQHYDAARTFQLGGDQEQAVGEYKAFLTEALRRVANAYARLGDFGAAAKLFEEALVLSPQNSDVRLDYSVMSLQEGKPLEAKMLAEKALELAPDNAKTHSVLGRVLFAQGDYRAAKEHLEAAAAAAPDFDIGYLLGITYIKLNDLNRAAMLFNEMTSGLGDSPQIHVYFARAYRAGGHLDQAIEELKRANARDSRVPQAHYFLGLAYLERDSESGFPEAMPEFRAELKVNPDDERSHYLLGYILLRQRNLKEAEPELVRATQLEPRNPDPFIYLGQLYMETNRLKEAEAATRTAIGLTTDVSRNDYQINRAHYILARIMLNTGRREAADKELALSEELRNRLSRPELAPKQKFSDYPNLSGEETIYQEPAVGAISPEEQQKVQADVNKLKTAIGEAYNNVGVIAAGQRNFAAAAEYFRKAADWNPSLETLDRNFGMAAFYAGQYDQAVAPLERHLHGRADDTRVRAALGLSFFTLANYRRALEILRPIEAEVSRDPGLSYAYAVSLVKTGSYTQGVDRLKALETANPNSADIHVLLGEAFADQGVYGTALEEYRKALAIDPNQARTHFLAGLVLIHQGRPTDATPELRAALKLDPSDVETKYHLAFALLQTQQKDEAVPLLQEVIRQDPKNADAYYQLGKLQLDQGETEAAISNLETGIKLNPDSDYIHYQLALAYRRGSRTEDAEREMKLYQALKNRRRGRNAPQPN